jgi:membrane-associated PAP2 superfamily phosphatase
VLHDCANPDAIDRPGSGISSGYYHHFNPYAVPTLFDCCRVSSRSFDIRSTSSISSIRADCCLCFPLCPLFIFNPISYLNLFHLVFRISEGLTLLADRVYAFGGGGSGVEDALLADSIVFSSAASISIATELVARKETKRDAKALCRLLTGVVFVSACDVLLAAVVTLDFCAWNPDAPDI